MYVCIHISSRYCNISSSSFSAIGSLWPTIQAKMGRIHFSTIMASKLLQSLQIWYKQLYRECLHLYWFGAIVGPLEAKNTRKGELSRTPNRWQAIIWTNSAPIHWRIYAALLDDELSVTFLVMDCTIQKVLSRLVIGNPPNLKYSLWGRDLSLGVYL